jgi:hypothetical protein
LPTSCTRGRPARAGHRHGWPARTGRTHFHVFGEGFGIDKPGQDEQARKIESYMTDGQDGQQLAAWHAELPALRAWATCSRAAGRRPSWATASRA